MIAYVFRRLIATIPVMGVVAIFVFSLLYLAPGDPAAIIAGDLATAQDIARIHHQLGLDEPFLLRFWHWAWGVLRGHRGTHRHDARRLGGVGDPDRRAGGMARGHLDRPRGHGLCRSGLLGAVLRARLRLDPDLLCRVRLASGAGLHQHYRGVLAVPAAFDPAFDGARADLRR